MDTTAENNTAKRPNLQGQHSQYDFELDFRKDAIGLDRVSRRFGHSLLITVG